MSPAATRTERDFRIPTADGNSITATCHYPGTSSCGAVLICPAMGVTAKYYASFARFLCAQGFDVVRFDYQGMGNSRSDSLHDSLPNMLSWAENDLAAVLDWMNENLQAGPIAIVGHSAGGQLAGISKSDISVNAILLVASQSGYWRHWAGIKRLSMFLLWYLLIPVLSNAFGRFPARALRLGDDLPKNVAMQWAEWGRKSNYIASDIELSERFASYSGPILAYSFSDDAFAPAKAVNALLSFYSNATIEHRTIDAADLPLDTIGHFGFFREKIAKELLWECSVTWLKSKMKQH